MPHEKPTPEELDQNALKALEEAEALKKETKPEEEADKEVDKEVEEKQEEPQKEADKEVEVEADYKKKFVASTQEAQILHEKNKKLTSIIEQADNIPEPTEDELKKEYTDWDELTATQQKMAKDTLVSNRRFKMLSEVTSQFKDMEAWQEKVVTFLDDPKSLVDHPELEGKQDEFKLFATKPTRRGIDMDVLISAFLFDAGKERRPNKGKMFETGTGGPSDKGKPKSDKISLEEARTLRNADYAKYKEYLKAGKIDSGI
jgi:hypothetical protein